MKTKKIEKKESVTWIFKLYVAGENPKSLLTFNNLKKICEEQLNGKYQIELIDLQKNPELSRDDQIFAIPTLVRKLPTPIKKLIGDLSDSEKVLIALDIKRAKI